MEERKRRGFSLSMPTRPLCHFHLRRTSQITKTTRAGALRSRCTPSSPSIGSVVVRHSPVSPIATYIAPQRHDESVSVSSHTASSTPEGASVECGSGDFRLSHWRMWPAWSPRRLTSLLAYGVRVFGSDAFDEGLHSFCSGFAFSSLPFFGVLPDAMPDFGPLFALAHPVAPCSSSPL